MVRSKATLLFEGRDRNRLTISVLVLSFFFSSRRRHTRFDCDWSSDVCSSDLTQIPGRLAGPQIAIGRGGRGARGMPPAAPRGLGGCRGDVAGRGANVASWEIGRASCRERV